MQGIDLLKTFNFFFKSKNWFSTLLTIGGIVLLLYLSMIFAYFLFFVPIIAAGSDAGPAVALISMLLICLTWFGILVATIVMGLYLKGKSIIIYKHLCKGDNKYATFDTLPKDSFSETISQGIKFWIVNIFYNLPLIVGYIVFYIGFFFLMGSIPFLEQGNMSSDSPSIAVLIFFGLFYMGIFALVGFQTVYLYFVNFAIKPIVFDRISKYGYKSCFSIFQILREFKANIGHYLLGSLFLLVLYVFWFIIYYANFFLVFLCIGVFLFPFVFGLFYIIQIYLEPHLIHQINSNAKD
jgi:hypothetical protein